MAKEVLPNPGNTLQSMQYVFDQVARGAFEGTPATLAVLLYLVMNMWVKEPNKEGAGVGDVMYGRASVDCIARHTALSRRSVQYALKWLHEHRWIDTERAYAGTGREDKRYITVLLDQRAARERDRIRQAGDALDKILAEAGRVQ